MKKSIEIDINKDDCYKLAKSILMQISGLDKNRDGVNFAKMRKDAEFVIDKMKDLIQLKVACNYYDKVLLNGPEAIIAGERFNCRAFQQIKPESVKGAFVYAISGGDFSLEDESTLKQVYADLWGTALIDALRVMLRQELQKVPS